jgi:hypothetical protein
MLSSSESGNNKPQLEGLAGGRGSAVRPMLPSTVIEPAGR